MPAAAVIYRKPQRKGLNMPICGDCSGWIYVLSGLRARCVSDVRKNVRSKQGQNDLCGGKQNISGCVRPYAVKRCVRAGQIANNILE